MFNKVIILSATLAISACSFITDTANLPLNQKLRQLTLVEENHFEIEKDGEKYLLDTYIEPFQQPYYIHVRKESNTPVDKDIAVELSKAYIKTRGCTQEIKRPFNTWDYDINNFRSKAWLIYLTC